MSFTLGPTRSRFSAGLTALEQTGYVDAKQRLLELEAWLWTKNESAADSLLEAFEGLLTLHRLKVPALLRKTLRWLGTVLLYCEKQLKRVQGFAGIAQVVATIEAEQAEQPPALTKKAA